MLQTLEGRGNIEAVSFRTGIILSDQHTLLRLIFEWVKNFDFTSKKVYKDYLN